MQSEQLFDAAAQAAVESLQAPAPTAWLGLFRLAVLAQAPSTPSAFELAAALSRAAEEHVPEMPPHVGVFFERFVVAQLEFLAAYERITDPSAAAARTEARANESRVRAGARAEADAITQALATPDAHRVWRMIQDLARQGQVAMDDSELGRHLRLDHARVREVTRRLHSVGLIRRTILRGWRPHRTPSGHRDRT